MKIFENEHPLETPDLIGTDAEKIAGIKFWADLIALVRSIDTTFISYENKLAIIQFLKKELDLVDVEINNISATVVSKPGEIPSAEQLPAAVPEPEQNIVDLSKSAEVAASAAPVLPAPPAPPVNPITKAAVKTAPTFSDLDKLRRVAGNSTRFVPENKVTPTATGIKSPTFTDLEKLRRAAGAGKYGIHHADTKK